jgi:hypothetical protein
VCASGPVSRPGRSKRSQAPTAFLKAVERIAACALGDLSIESTGVLQVRAAALRRSASTFEKSGVWDREV